MSRIQAGCLLGVVSVCLLAGCDDGYAPKAIIEKVVPVSGTLSYQGRPLEYFQVTLQPDGGQRTAVGVTDAAGKFTLGTNKAGDGAPPGPCKISVNFVGPPVEDTAGLEPGIEDPSKLPKPPVKLPAKFGNPETSGLVLDIPAGGVSDLKLDLQP